MRRGTQILHWPGGGFSQTRSGMNGPVRVPQEFAGEQHEVCLTGADNVVGLCGVGDKADGSGENSGFAADAFREGRLITRPYGNFRRRH